MPISEVYATNTHLKHEVRQKWQIIQITDGLTYVQLFSSGFYNKKYTG